MPNWASNLSAISLAITTATVATATPPRVVAVEDRLFARTSDMIFLIREVFDNHGAHHIAQTDLIYVTRSLRDGADRGFQVIERMVTYTPDPDRPSGTGNVTYHTPVSRIDPYAAREDAGAWPVGPLTLDASPEMDAGGIRVTATDGASYFLDTQTVQSLVDDTLLTVRQIVPDLDLTPDPDSFDPLAFDVSTDCSVVTALTFWPATDDPAMVQLACEVADNLQFATLWLVVPKI